MSKAGAISPRSAELLRLIERHGPMTSAQAFEHVSGNPGHVSSRLNNLLQARYLCRLHAVGPGRPITYALDGRGREWLEAPRLLDMAGLPAAPEPRVVCTAPTFRPEGVYNPAADMRSPVRRGANDAFALPSRHGGRLVWPGGREARKRA